MEGGRGLKLPGDEVAEVGEVPTPSPSAASFMKKKSLAPLEFEDDEPVSSSSSSAKKRGCLGADVNGDDLEDDCGISKADAPMMPPAIPTMDFPSRRLERDSSRRGARMRAALERASARRGQRAGRRDELRCIDIMLGSLVAVVLGGAGI